MATESTGKMRRIGSLRCRRVRKASQKKNACPDVLVYRTVNGILSMFCDSRREMRVGVKPEIPLVWVYFLPKRLLVGGGTVNFFTQLGHA